MRITCPSCLAEYDVPGPLAPGRRVKCARCASQWAPVAAIAPVAIEADDALVRPQEMIAPAPLPRSPSPHGPLTPVPESPLAVRSVPVLERRAPLLLAWVASLAVIVALAAAAYQWRAPIMQAWPPSVRVYAALGLTGSP